MAKRFTNGALLLPNLIQALYRNAFKPLLFSLDAERAHNLAVGGLRVLESKPALLNQLAKRLVVEDARLEMSVRSLTVPNPVGLAAGFDKSAELIGVLPSFGFGFIEAGTFTPLPQSGQAKPRLFRYRKQKALINRMGFNNPGARAAADRLRACKNRSVPIGINIGKNKDTPMIDAVKDYEMAFDTVLPFADYVVLNVSSPNTPNLREMQEFEALWTLLKAISDRNRTWANLQGRPPKLLFLKVSPDNEEVVLEECVRACVELGIGMVATNTSTDHSLLGFRRKTEPGGLSGRPLMDLSDRVLKKIAQMSKGTIPLIGVGGIFSAEDAYRKIRLGAHLVQVYTGWIYEGPGLVARINQGLLKLMKKDGFQNIREAVGTL